MGMVKLSSHLDCLLLLLVCQNLHTLWCDDRTVAPVRRKRSCQAENFRLLKETMDSNA